MMHLAYPNVDTNVLAHPFWGCVRYRSLAQAPGSPYRLATAQTPHRTDVLAAVEALVPEWLDRQASARVYEIVDAPRSSAGDSAPHSLAGASLDLAYLLATIRCVRSLRLEALQDAGDVWCTGEIAIHSQNEPALGAVEERGFAGKLRGFLNQQQDRLFFVPATNMGDELHSLCETKRVPVLQLTTFRARLEQACTTGSWPELTVITVGAGQLRQLVDGLFERDAGEDPIDGMPELNHHRDVGGRAWLQVVALLGLLLSLLGYFSRHIVLPLWMTPLLLLVTLWSCRTLLSAFLDLLIRRSKPDFPHGDIFRGIFTHDTHVLAGQEGIFDRSREVKNLIKTITDPRKSDRILAVTGDSGIGKSVLVRLLVERLKGEGANHFRICLGRFNDPERTNIDVVDDLLSFVRSHANLLSSQEDDACYVVIIIDQFESCLDQIIDAYLHKNRGRASLRNFLADSQQHSNEMVRKIGDLLSLQKDYKRLKIVVSLRSDRYYDLRLLGEYGQIPYDAFEVQGIADGQGTNTILNALDKINFKFVDAQQLVEDLKEQDGTILPVKMQIIGTMLERIVFYPSRYGTIYGTIQALLGGSRVRRRREPRVQLTLSQYRELGGAAGLIERYFRLVLQSCPSPDIARELLFVLSLEGRVKTRYTSIELAAVIFREEDDIQETLLYLVKEGLLAVCYGQYAFVHDYLAQCYNQLSGRLLPPVVRDNLAYSHATLMEGKKKLSLDSRGFDIHEGIKYTLYATNMLMLAFFGYRFLHFTIFPLEYSHQWFGLPFLPGFGLPFAPYKVSPAWSMDWHYLPIGFVQCCWGLYVCGLVTNVFVHVDHTFAMRLESAGLVMFALIGLIWTAFIPGLWLVWIGINGVFVGLKFSHLGYRVYRFTSGRNRYSIIGVYTLINSFFVLYIGSRIFPYVAWDLPNEPKSSLSALLTSFLSLSPHISFFSVYYACIPIFVYFVYMYRAHVLPNRAVEFIGLYKRVEAIA